MSVSHSADKTGHSTTQNGQYIAATGKAKSQLSVVNTPALYQYSNSISLRTTDIQQQLYNVITQHRSGQMASMQDEAQFLQWLCNFGNVKTVVEVGVFLGSTTLAIALSPSVQKIYGLDVSNEYINVARPYWEKAGVSNKIDVRIGSAIDTMKQLISQNLANTIDLIFIDADKSNYDQYYELAVQLVKPNGVIAIDNVYRHGDVIAADVNATDDADGTRVIKALNERIHADERVDITILPLADGLTLCRKR